MQLILCKDNANRTQPSLLEIAEVKLILYKDNANRTQSSLLEIAEVKLILYKDNANRTQSSLLEIAEVKLILCKYRNIFPYTLYIKNKKKSLPSFSSVFPTIVKNKTRNFFSYNHHTIFVNYQIFFPNYRTKDSFISLIFFADVHIDEIRTAGRLKRSDS